jgi:protein-export membrane protein SecD
MSTSLKIKIFLILGILALSVYLLYPTYTWYRLPLSERIQREKSKDKILNKILNLGLDLRGGMHLVLEVDTMKLEPGTSVSDAVDRALEVIRNRIDQFGVAEPMIVRQGEKWIALQLPGVREPERVKEIIGKTALLEFRLVDNSGAISKIAEKIRELNLSWEELPRIQEELKTLIPTGYVLLPGKGSYYLLKSTPEISGAYLIGDKVKVEIGGEYGFPYVGLKFNKEGAKIFAQTTGLNVGRNLAIVLDNIVQSAPVIRTRIPDGNAIIEGNFTLEEAKNLAIVLRSGALPAPLKIIEERTIGPSLGEDSIQQGIQASILGCLFVFVFIVVYYHLSGLIADIALLMNFILLLGAMAYLRATLTLPGIAGIILSLGMAVDANVLIFERIREELELGKTVRVAIDLGYSKAFSAIVDSNLTTLIAALFLFQFGTGPVRGFAVTLTLGIVISMFTAIVVTRTIYEYTLTERTIKHLSI